MSLWDKIGKLGEIITKPIDLLTDWGREPLRSREHNRSEASKDNELKRDIERRTAEMKISSEIGIKEKEAETDLAIKKETEVVRIIAEIEEWKKDQDFSRMKAVSETIMKYQQELTRLNVNAINAIGNMQLELRERAQNLVYEKTIKYKELQDIALREAAEELKKIETEFADNEAAKNILINAVDRRLSNIIDTAHNFLIELNSDIKLLNNKISLLSDNGQKFIERHLDQFHLIGFSSGNIKQLENQSDQDWENTDV